MPVLRLPLALWGVVRYPCYIFCYDTVEEFSNLSVIAFQKRQSVTHVFLLVYICGHSWKGFLLIDYFARVETVNADAYCATLKTLRSANQNCPRGLPQTADKSTQLLEKFDYETFYHRP
jgi:hypothetical protein